MARTKEEILKEIQDAFIANAILQQIYGISGNNTFEDEFSITSLESQFVEIIANESKTIEDLYDLNIDEITTLLNQKTPGTVEWYRRMALGFQYPGYALLWNEDKLVYEYPEIVEDAQIVKLVSVNESSSELIMKLAKLNQSGNPEQLTLTELTAFISYFQQVKYAGVSINYVSRPADILRLKLKVYYNATVINTDGSLISDPTTFPVSDAVNEYLKLLPFNGRFNVTDLIDTLQLVAGVINPLFVSAHAKYGTQAFTPIVDYYQANAGYMEVDTLMPLEVEYIAI